jgi:type I restriction enzyme M protein
LDGNQAGSILGEYRRFLANPDGYDGYTSPDCLAMGFVQLWTAHASNRLDPKYHLFKAQESLVTPDGWIRLRLGQLMRRRLEIVDPAERPDEHAIVLTISNTGDLRLREAGKGRNPPEWLGMYFAEMPSTWYRAHEGNVVYSSIDLWKGCIAVVLPEFDGGLVTKEFPIYEIVDDRMSAQFMSALLRSRYYQRAFRAITTGHSNRRRTQQDDFENLEVCFPPDVNEQSRLMAEIEAARLMRREGDQRLREAQLAFDNLVDGRGDEALPEVEAALVDNNGDE